MSKKNLKRNRESKNTSYKSKLYWKDSLDFTSNFQHKDSEMDSALFEYENCFLNLFMSSLHLLRHIFWKKHATFYNISLSSLRTIEVSPSKRRRK